LLEDAEISSIAKEIFEAPFCLLIHDYFEVEETRFVYANQSALEMVEATWEDVVSTPSSFFSSLPKEAGVNSQIPDSSQ